MNIQSGRPNKNVQDIRIPEELIASSSAPEINAFFAKDPDVFGENPLSEAAMQNMRCLDEGRLWSSSASNEDAYNMYAYLDTFINDPNPSPENYTVIGLTGYGLVSNFFTYYSVEPRLAVFAQLSYGNISEQDFQTDMEPKIDLSIMGLLACKKDFDELIQQIEKAGKWPEGAMLVIQESDRDGIYRCGWRICKPGSQAEVKWLKNDPTPEGTVLVELMKLLEE